MPCDGSVVTNMRPQDVLLEHANGDEEALELEIEDVARGKRGVGAGVGAGGTEDGEEEEENEEEEIVLEPEHAARLLARLNALRKSRQHYDVLLTARDGVELAAHGAVLAAASPRLLRLLGDGPRALRVDVPGDALAALLDAVYSGRLRAPPGPPAGPAALALCAAAAELRLDAARDALVRRALRRPAPAAALALRALPALPAATRDELDSYIAANFDEVCASGALAALPTLRLEVQRECGAACGGAAGVAAAALAWLRAAPERAAALSARTHQLYLDGVGALQECGTAGGAGGAAGGERAAGEWRVLAARGDEHCTRALLALPAGLALARVGLRRAAGAAVPAGVLVAEGGELRAALGAGRCAFGAAVLEGRLVVCGGYDAARVLAAAEAYCPRSNAWLRLPDMRGARARFGAARLGSALYACGGSDGHAELASVEALRDGAWRAAARLPAAAAHGAALAAGDRLLLVGGWAAGRSLRTVLSYSPEDDRWSECPSLNTARSQCAGAYWRGEAWALGGADDWRCLSSCEVLRVGPGGDAGGAGGWRAGPALLAARRAAGVADWRGALWLAGGSDGAASLASTEYLESASGAWRGGPALRRARAAAALAALGGALYCVGGYSGRDFLPCVECLYHPAGAWTGLAIDPGLAPAVSIAAVIQPTENGDHKVEEVSDTSQPPVEEAVDSTPHAVDSTLHAVDSTPYAADLTPHAADSTPHADT